MSLSLMQAKSQVLCEHCNIITYDHLNLTLKTVPYTVSFMFVD